MNAQNFIRPSSSGAFGGGASSQERLGQPASSFLGPQNLESAAQPPRSGASTFPPVGERGFEEPLPSRGAASEFAGTEQSPADAAAESAAREASGPRFLLDNQKPAHNFKLGPVFFRLGASLSFEFTDNVDNSSTDRQGDLITTGAIFLNGQWAVTKINDLNLRLGIGYTSYLANPELNSVSQTLELTPGTEIAFKMKLGPVFLNFYERPTVGQDTSTELTLQNGLIYTSFQNIAGVTAFLDLNDVSVQAGYNRSDTIPLTSQSNSVSRSGDSSSSENQRRAEDNATLDSLNRSVDTLSTTITFRIDEDTSAGFEAAVSRITYKEDVQEDGFSYNAGVFVGKQLTRYITLRVGAGYQQSNFEAQSGQIDNDSGGGSKPYYYNLELRHRVNRFLSHSLAMGYEADLGTTTNTVQTTYFNERITYNISRDLALNLNISYEIGDESGGQDAQSLKLFRVGLSCGYNLSRKLSMSAYYEFVTRSGGGAVGDSNTEGSFIGESSREYYQNRIGINFSYAF